MTAACRLWLPGILATVICVYNIALSRFAIQETIVEDVPRVPQSATQAQPLPFWPLLANTTAVESSQAVLEQIRQPKSEFDPLYSLLQPPAQPIAATFRKVLVIYSGPTDVLPFEPQYYYQGLHNNAFLYQQNFEYFLQHGIQCQVQDTAIVLTKATLALYQNRLEQLDKYCQEHYQHRVFIVLREHKCLDMESLRRVLEDVPHVYDYSHYVYLNCGVIGPSPDYNIPYATALLAHLDESVKMTGLSVNCYCEGKTIPHVQSMVFATDATGWKLLSQIPFDCESDEEYQMLSTDFDKREYIILKYECAMGAAMLEAGYSIWGMLNTDQVSSSSADSCSVFDVFKRKTMTKLYGRIPHFNETLFWKSSRFVTHDMAQLMGTQELETLRTWHYWIDYPGRMLKRYRGLWAVLSVMFLLWWRRKKQMQLGVARQGRR